MRLSPWTALRSPPTKRIQDTSLFRAGDRQAPPASTAWNAGIAIGMQQTILTACSTVLHPRPPASTVSTILRGDALDAPSDLCHPLGTSISAPCSYSRTSGVPPSALPIPMPASARPRPILSPPSPLSGHPPSVSTAVGQWPRPCAMNPGRWLTPMAISPEQGCTATFAHRSHVTWPMLIICYHVVHMLLGRRPHEHTQLFGATPTSHFLRTPAPGSPASNADCPLGPGRANPGVATTENVPPLRSGRAE